jgi:hypothetical protein
MSSDEAERPQLSYVLAAMTSVEIDRALAWLRTTPVVPTVEVVLAAPASLLGRIAGRLIPPQVQLASAIRPVDRKAVRVAGARETRGLVVMVVDCDDDIAERVRGPLGESAIGDELAFEDPTTWADPSPAPVPRAQRALPPGSARVSANVSRIAG